MNNKVLYYPSIEFYDVSWVKASLCIWDKVYRIVPSTYIPNDCLEIETFINHGLVDNISIEQNDLSETADNFIDFIEKIPGLPAGIEGYEKINLHKEKVDDRILPILEAISDKFELESWIPLSRPIVNAYMLFFAETISRRRKMPKITDNVDMYTIMHYFMADGNIDESIGSHEHKEYSINLVLENIIPADINTVSPEIILNFREATEDIRDTFRNYVYNLIDEIKSIESESYAKEIITDSISDISKNNSSQKRVIKELGMNFTTSFLSIGIPTTISAIALFSNTNNIFSINEIMGSVFIGAVASIADTVRSRRKDWSSEESLFMHELDRRFDTYRNFRPTTNRHFNILEEYIND